MIAWCGMRGTVTLAAALALPDGLRGQYAFPHRDLILFTAFCVVLATLVVQGMTVRPLMRKLELHDDGSVEREVRLARAETARAAIDAVSGAEAADAEMVQLLRRKYEDRLTRQRGDRQDFPPRTTSDSRISSARSAELRRPSGASSQRCGRRG